MCSARLFISGIEAQQVITAILFQHLRETNTHIIRSVDRAAASLAGEVLQTINILYCLYRICVAKSAGHRGVLGLIETPPALPNPFGLIV